MLLSCCDCCCCCLRLFHYFIYYASSNWNRLCMCMRTLCVLFSIYVRFGRPLKWNVRTKCSKCHLQTDTFSTHTHAVIALNSWRFYWPKWWLSHAWEQHNNMILSIDCWCSLGDGREKIEYEFHHFLFPTRCVFDDTFRTFLLSRDWLRINENRNVIFVRSSESEYVFRLK